MTSMEEDHIRQEAGGSARGPADGDQVWTMEERVPEELLLDLLSLPPQANSRYVSVYVQIHQSSLIYEHNWEGYVNVLPGQVSLITSIDRAIDSF